MFAGKIGVLIDQLHSGGVEKIAIWQVFYLNKIGIPTTLVVLKETPIAGHPFSDLLRQVPIVFLDRKLPKLLKFSFKLPFLAFFSFYHLSYPLFLPWVTGKKDYDIFISHGTYTTFTALSLKLVRKVPFIVILWDPITYILKKAYPTGIVKNLNFIFLPLGRLLDYLVVFKANKVLVAGGAHIDYLKKLGAKQVVKIYPGVSVAQPLPESRGDYILMVTAWKEGKNPEYNLELIKNFPTVKLVMAGTWYPESLQLVFLEKIKKLGLEKQVEVTGSLDEVSLKKLFLGARVFVQTNDDRGFGMPALEAASCGCPFIIPIGQGVGELFEDGVDGFFTKERDTNQIQEKLKLFLTDKDQAFLMGKNGWSKVLANYSWEKHAARLIREVESCR